MGFDCIGSRSLLIFLLFNDQTESVVFQHYRFTDVLFRLSILYTEDVFIMDFLELDKSVLE